MLKNKIILLGMLLLMVSTLVTAQTVQIDINQKVKRYLNDVSELDRSTFFNIHSNSQDAEHNDLFNTYGVDRGRGFWGPFSFARSKTGEVGEYPDPKSGGDEVRAVSRFISTEHPYNTFKDDLDPEKAAIWAVEYWKNFVDDAGRPEFFEVMNEPFVHTNDFYSGGWNSAKNAELVQEMTDLYAAVGRHIDESPALANMKVIGYSSAWPSMEINNFSHFEQYQKKFMDDAGEYMDAFATHLYDGINVSGQDNKRSGSNSEAILDLIETYSYFKWGVVKPHAITEYGGIEQGFGNDYSDLRNIQSIRAINHILFNLLEREENMAISIPFITGKATWHITENNNFQPYTPALWKPSNIGQPNPFGWQYTPKIHFYDLWKDVAGHRTYVQSDNPDIQSQSFVDGNKLYVALSNLDDFDRDVRVNLWGGTDGLEEVVVRTLKIFDDKLPEYTETNSTSAPGTMTMIPDETMVIIYTFADEIPAEQEVVQTKYYSENHIADIKLFNTEKFNFNGVAANKGYASLRMSISRKHNKTKMPTVTVNGTEIPVPSNWQGYDQANRDDFFGMIEIPVPMDLLSTDNEVGIKFSDAGGHISSVILTVNNSQFSVSNENIAFAQETLSIFPNPVRDQLNIDLGIENVSDVSVSISNNLGQFVSITKHNPRGSQISIPTASFDAGMYFVKAEADGVIKTAKFMILK